MEYQNHNRNYKATKWAMREKDRERKQQSQWWERDKERKWSSEKLRRTKRKIERKWVNPCCIEGPNPILVPGNNCWTAIAKIWAEEWRRIESFGRSFSVGRINREEEREEDKKWREGREKRWERKIFNISLSNKSDTQL